MVVVSVSNRFVMFSSKLWEVDAIFKNISFNWVGSTTNNIYIEVLMSNVSLGPMLQGFIL